jgi:hypothetical protein
MTTATTTSAAKLTDTAVVILSAAAQRQDRLLLPLPKSIKSPPKVIKSTIETLIAKSFVEERPAGLQDSVWREDEQHQKFCLSITDQGIAVLEAPRAEETTPAGPKELVKEKTKIRSPAGEKKGNKQNPSATKKSAKAGGPHKVKARTTSKSAQVLTLLGRSNGATIAEIMRATGWQAHSVRGFLSGAVKRRMGLKLLSEQEEGKDRRYRIKS